MTDSEHGRSPERLDDGSPRFQLVVNEEASDRELAEMERTIRHLLDGGEVFLLTEKDERKVREIEAELTSDAMEEFRKGAQEVRDIIDEIDHGGSNA